MPTPPIRAIGRPEGRARRLEAGMRGVLAALADEPAVRALGIPASLAGARLVVARHAGSATIIAIGPRAPRRASSQRATVLPRREPS